MKNAYESRVVKARENTHSTTAAGLARACHEIIDAASTIILSVEFMAQDREPSQVAAAHDARQSVERIVRIARSIRKWADDEAAQEANHAANAVGH